MNRLINHLKLNFYSELLLLVVLIVLLKMSLKKKAELPQFKLFPFYFGGFILLIVGDYFYLLFLIPYKKYYLIFGDGVLELIVTLLEITAFALFFFEAISAPLLKKATKLLTSIAILTLIISLIVTVEFPITNVANTLNNIYIIESVLFFIVALLYYLDALIINPSAELFKTPNFWVAAGISFYIIGTIPFSLVANFYLEQNVIRYANFYSIIYLFYLITFLSMLKGYLCSTRKPI